MSDDVTQRLAEIRERLGKTSAREWFTPGWSADGSSVGTYIDNNDCKGCSGIVSPTHEPSCGTEYVGSFRGDAEDLDLIVNAGRDIAFLLRHLDTHMRAVERLQALGDRWKNSDPHVRGELLQALYIDDRPLTEADIARGQQIARELNGEVPA